MDYTAYDYEESKYILVKDIANSWYPNCFAKNATAPVRRKIESAGIEVKKIRITTNKTGRSCTYSFWAINKEKLDDVEKLSPGTINVIQKIEEDEVKYGCTFYIIQKYPEDAPHIIKMGRTTKTAAARSKAFYVWNPKILREFPILPIDEKTLIRMISGNNKQIGDEEFIVNDIDSLLKKADIVMSLLPSCEDEEDED